MGSKANKVDSATRENFITAEIKVEDASRDIRLFNSYENVNKDNIKNDPEYEINCNENEIIKNIEIKLDEIPIQTIDTYLYKFPKEKTYKIKYSFKGKLTKTNYMFYSCDSIIKLDLSNFNTKNVNDMSFMFSFCKNLKSLDLTNFNTENVNNMYHMFYFCKSLTSLNLSSFNFGKVNNMNYMFACCSSLKKLVITDLESFNNKKNKSSGIFDDMEYSPKITSSNCCDCF